MLFNSYEFGVFFILVFLVAWALANHRPLRNLFLMASSLFFYSCWNPKYLLLLVAASGVDYIAGWRIGAEQRPRWRKGWLIASICSNLGILFAFKYYGFATSTLQVVGGWLGLSITLPHSELLLPVGISFYTFQSMSYTFDIYFGKLKPVLNYLQYMEFVAFFPQLVAGPIVRARDFLWQLQVTPRLNADESGEALYRVIRGLVKKVVIADFISVNFVDRVFNDPDMYSSVEVLLGIYGYTVQIYCDFSGYSDIAIGTARLLGFKLPENFDLPYRAASVREFWRRWHISLSSWLRDYLYIGLGGSRGKAKWLTYRNLFITMLLGGLWHGASWTFVAWGGLHGSALALQRWWEEKRGMRDAAVTARPAWQRLLLTLTTFHFVALCWVFFRAPTFGAALDVFGSLADVSLSVANVRPLVLLAIVAGYLGHCLPDGLFSRLVSEYRRLPAVAQAAVLCLVVWGVTKVAASDVVPFIYFQF